MKLLDDDLSLKEKVVLAVHICMIFSFFYFHFTCFIYLHILGAGQRSLLAEGSLFEFKGYPDTKHWDLTVIYSALDERHAHDRTSRQNRK